MVSSLAPAALPANDIALLSKDFTRAWESSREYGLVSPVVASYTGGSRYILGGYVSNLLSHIVNGTPRAAEPDIDITADVLSLNGDRPTGFIRAMNRFNTVKLKRPGLEVDLSCVRTDWEYARSQGIPGTIYGVFFCGPLTTSPIAYDLNTKTLLGDVGINAVLTGVMDVNNLPALLHAAARKDCKTIGEYVEGRNKYLGFEIGEYLAGVSNLPAKLQVPGRR